MEIHQQELYDEIFSRIPFLRSPGIGLNAPYVGPGYGSVPECKILVVFLNAYGVSPKEDSVAGRQYPIFSKKNMLVELDFKNVKTTRQKVEEAIHMISSGKTIDDIAHYHYISRLLKSPTDRYSRTDLDEAIEAFPKVIDVLKPTHVLFFGNECLRTIARRDFSASLEGKSVEKYLADKGIAFSTISRRSDFKAKSSELPNQDGAQDHGDVSDEVNKYLDQLEQIYNEKMDSPLSATGAAVAGGVAAAAAGAVARSVATTVVGSGMGAVAGGAVGGVLAGVAAPVAAGLSAYALIQNIRALINRSKAKDAVERAMEDFGMPQKKEFIVELARKNQEKGTAMTFAQLAEELNKAGIQTARGEKFSTDGKGPFLLVNKVFKSCIAELQDYDAALAIAMAFINEKTGLPWKLNEIVDDLVDKKIALYQDGVLTSGLTYKPITIQDITPELIKNSPVKIENAQFKAKLVEYFAERQK